MARNYWGDIQGVLTASIDDVSKFGIEYKNSYKWSRCDCVIETEDELNNEYCKYCYSCLQEQKDEDLEENNENIIVEHGIMCEFEEEHLETVQQNIMKLEQSFGNDLLQKLEDIEFKINEIDCSYTHNCLIDEVFREGADLRTYFLGKMIEWSIITNGQCHFWCEC